MFCSECGTSLHECAKFCYNCGAKVTIPASISLVEKGDFASTVEATVDTSTEEQNDGITLSLLGNELFFPEEMVRYNETRSIFYECAKIVSSGVYDISDKILQSFDSIFDTVPSYANSGIYQTLDVGIKFLMQIGIDDVDLFRLRQICGDSIDPDNFMRYFSEKSEEIERHAHLVADIKGVKTSPKGGYWQGGGIGLKGAIKGAITAEALNLGADAIQQVSEDRAEAINAKIIEKSTKEGWQDFLAEEDVLERIAKGIFQCCMSVFTHGVYPILVNRGLLSDLDFDTSDQRARVNNYKSIYHESNTSETAQLFQNALFDLIKINPFDSYPYTELYCEYQDKIDDILQVADYFNIGNRVREFVIYHAKAIILPKITDDLPDDTVEQIEEKAKQLASFKERFSEVDISDWEKHLQEKADKIKSEEAKKRLQKEKREKARKEKEENEKYQTYLPSTDSFSIEEETQLLEAAEKHGFQSAAILSDISGRKERLNRKIELSQLSFEDRFSAAWPAQQPDPEKNLQNSIRGRESVKLLRYGLEAKIIFSTGIREVDNGQQFNLFLIVTAYYVVFWSDVYLNPYAIRTKDLVKIEYCTNNSKSISSQDCLKIYKYYTENPDIRPLTIIDETSKQIISRFIGWVNKAIVDVRKEYDSHPEARSLEEHISEFQAITKDMALRICKDLIKEDPAKKWLSKKEKTRSNAISLICNNMVSESDIVLLNDTSLLCNGKEGAVLTDKYFIDNEGKDKKTHILAYTSIMKTTIIHDSKNKHHDRLQIQSYDGTVRTHWGNLADELSAVGMQSYLNGVLFFLN